MKNSLIAPSNELARHLVNLGCSLDTLNVHDDGFEAMRRRLVIAQEGGTRQNSLLDFGGIWTGCEMFVRIGYGAAGKMTISDWDLEVPGFNSQFLLLDDPFENVPKTNFYQIPGPIRKKYAREDVINHRRVLKRGDLVEGFLLGWWCEPLPEIYTHGITVSATLSLQDQNYHSFSTQFELWINRKIRPATRHRKGLQRRRLFDEQDMRTLEEVRELVTSS